MKPKIFIGSSVEGLNIAYAIQQNLTHDAESTVWDQGVFDLSKTTIESLDKTLESMDFGVFVFSADDVTTMRDKESPTVRDNVLFELGLFIGKMGRNRVFFVIPDGTTIHIPTDLLGVTPGKYESGRADGSFQAATGAVCNQMRTQIKSLGLLRERTKHEDSGDSTAGTSKTEDDWFSDFIKNDYKAATDKLKKGLSKINGDEKLKNEMWISFIKLKQNDKDGLLELCNFAKSNVGNFEVESLVPQMLYWEDYHDKSIEIATASYEASNSCPKLATVLAEAYDQNDDTDMAREILQKHNPDENPTVAMALASTFEKKSEDKLKILIGSYENNANDEKLIYALARELQDQNRNKESLYLLDFLVFNYPKSETYWGYLSNTCVDLNLYEKAMFSCRKAEELTESKSPWILHNIGNMLNNKGFHSEAIDWLKKAIKMEPESEYAHDRLAKALKSKDEQREKYIQYRKEGKKSLRNLNFSADADA
ncbi:DNA-binding protein [Colwellia sp. 75C3]|uniref:TIR domain-containing protein n=1 Tax=Colwellia sp. 75C3 TaxID=888425 RepID=UPI000C3288F7|nr:TIR domain-containing protein [Colwellia sp. 75C3]PKG83501.1 DNA-binding protein [Colwellia sp. 75C3]